MKNKYQDIQNTKLNIDSSGKNWQDLAFSHPERMINIATTFSGIGAIEHAFQRLKLNYEIQFAGDIDVDCKKSYFANYNITEDKWHTDIHNFNAKPYKGKVDLLVGGAPCQAFSLRGKHGGFEDTRGTLFREFARVVIECKPKIFLFENVRGMLYHDKGKTWQVIKNTFEESCDYDIYYQVLNSKDYGIPQNRERIYCIGFKKETDFKYPAPIPLTRKMYNFLEETVDNKYFLKEKGFQFITKSINHQKSYTQINGDIQLCQKRNQQFNWHGDFIFYPYSNNIESNEYKPLIHKLSDAEERYYVENKFSHYICPNNNYNMVCETSIVDMSKGLFRKLTPRECLRLMGFNDSYDIVVSDTVAYKQSGNSIVVDVLMALLKQI